MFEGWTITYSWETSKAVRQKGRTKQYSETLVPRLQLSGTSPVLAKWPDGFEAELGVSQAEVWPKKFSSKSTKGGPELPKNGKKQKVKGGDRLWTGTMETGKVIYTQWRSSRGWQVSLYDQADTGKKENQLCQLKPSSYECNDTEKVLHEVCVHLMTRLGQDLVNGKTKIDEDLLQARDNLLPEFHLTAIKGSTKPRAQKRATQETPEPQPTVERLAKQGKAKPAAKRRAAAKGKAMSNDIDKKEKETEANRTNDEPSVGTTITMKSVSGLFQNSSMVHDFLDPTSTSTDESSAE